MHRWAAVFLAVFLISMPCASGAAGSGGIDTGRQAYHFGTVYEGDAVFHDFSVKNTDPDPLRILKIEAG